MLKIYLTTIARRRVLAMHRGRGALLRTGLDRRCGNRRRHALVALLAQRVGDVGRHVVLVVFRENLFRYETPVSSNSAASDDAQALQIAIRLTPVESDGPVTTVNG